MFRKGFFADSERERNKCGQVPVPEGTSGPMKKPVSKVSSSLLVFPS
jgi:hypothetical protein